MYHPEWCTASVVNSLKLFQQILLSYNILQMLQIHNGSVEVDASIMGAQQDGKKVKVPLNSR